MTETKNATTILIFWWIHILMLLLLLSCEKDQGARITDIDGNEYDTVRISTQVWMKENLRTTRLNDGIEIPLVPDATEWGLLKTPGYCWYGNNEAFFTLNHYGALYNYYAVNTGKLCPKGWHVPTNSDWLELAAYVGWDSGGGKLREEGTVNWANPNSSATNETGFSALPGGYRNAYYKDYNKFRYNAYFWKANSNDTFLLNNYDSNVTSSPTMTHTNGASVRCIMDKK